MKILIVDDDKFSSVILRHRLEDVGFDVMVANHPQAALEQMTLSQIDLVLTDYHMPELTGFELYAQIQQQYPHLPVILMSSTITPKVKEQAIELGMMAVVNKPLDMLQLQPYLQRVAARDYYIEALVS